MYNVHVHNVRKVTVEHLQFLKNTGIQVHSCTVTKYCIHVHVIWAEYCIHVHVIWAEYCIHVHVIWAEYCIHVHVKVNKLLLLGAQNLWQFL